MAGEKNYVENLLSLTNKESGVVLYANNEALILNWAGINGYPRLDPWGCAPVGLGEKLPKKRGKNISSATVKKLLDGVEIIYDRYGDAVVLKSARYRARLYTLPEAIVIAI